MRKLTFLILLTYNLLAQTEQSNILTYYAVDNSIDGQIMIEKINYLRFVPVFAIREKVQKVTVSIYSGSLYYTREALPSTDSTYWQSILPQFSLGDVIQRVEVEVKFALDDNSMMLKKNFENKLIALQDTLKDAKKVFAGKIDTIAASLAKAKNNADSLSKFLRKRLERWKGFSLRIDSTDSLNKVFIHVIQLQKELTDSLEILLRKTKEMKSELEKEHKTGDSSINDKAEKKPAVHKPVTINNAKANKYSEFSAKADEIKILGLYIDKNLDSLKKNKELARKKIEELLGGFINISSASDTAISKCANELFRLTAYTKGFLEGTVQDSYRLLDTIQNNIYRKILGNLVDKEFTGQSVQKSDVVVDLTANTARILYRNYKSANRKMPAIDPKEKFGIFRGRFIPLPVTCT
ncbi:MAG: hypothetical protein HY965_06755, partial [Ignavibacteriales bacterium]|nr:hypothetical protein [Ignavibacteriales bacterium]